MAASSPTTILVADDHPIFRRGLVDLIAAEPRFTVVAEVCDGEAALAAIEALRPDVAVLDIAMPGLDGLAVARAAMAQRIPLAIVVLTMHEDEDMLHAAIDLGVRGYVLKDSAALDVVRCIRDVSTGKHYVSPSLAPYLVRRRTRATALAREKPGLDDLTPAERRVLKLIAEGQTSKEIADTLCISHRTVENHRTNIAQKLGLRGSHALVKFALAHRFELL